MRYEQNKGHMSPELRGARPPMFIESKSVLAVEIYNFSKTLTTDAIKAAVHEDPVPSRRETKIVSW